VEQFGGKSGVVWLTPYDTEIKSGMVAMHFLNNGRIIALD